MYSHKGAYLLNTALPQQSMNEIQHSLIVEECDYLFVTAIFFISSNIFDDREMK